MILKLGSVPDELGKSQSGPGSDLYRRPQLPGFRILPEHPVDQGSQVHQPAVAAQIILNHRQGSGSPEPGVCTSNGEIFLNVYEMNVLDTIKRHLFCFYTFVVRRSLKALEPRIRIRSEFSPDPGL